MRVRGNECPLHLSCEDCPRGNLEQAFKMCQAHYPQCHGQAGERGALPHLQGPLSLIQALTLRERAGALCGACGGFWTRFHFKRCQGHKDNKPVMLTDCRMATHACTCTHPPPPRQLTHTGQCPPVTGAVLCGEQEHWLWALTDLG